MSSARIILGCLFCTSLLLIDACSNDGIIDFTVPKLVDLHSLIPEIKVSPGAPIDPPSLQMVDLTQTVIYKVTAPDVTTKKPYRISWQMGT